MANPDNDARARVYAMAGIYTFGGFSMTGDRNETGGQDHFRILADHEIRDWSRKYGVSEARLRTAVGKVGNMAADVERELRSS